MRRFNPRHDVLSALARSETRERLYALFGRVGSKVTRSAHVPSLRMRKRQRELSSSGMQVLFVMNMLNTKISNSIKDPLYHNVCNNSDVF